MNDEDPVLLEAELKRYKKGAMAAYISIALKHLKKHAALFLAPRVCYCGAKWLTECLDSLAVSSGTLTTPAVLMPSRRHCPCCHHGGPGLEREAGYRL